jgi:E3 ubiquitin-protein ligase MYCBP2
MDFGTDFPAITAILETSAKLRGLVIQNATERLEMEGRDKDKEIHDPKHPYFKKPVEYAMAIFCFYECYKCKKPYALQT